VPRITHGQTISLKAVKAAQAAVFPLLIGKGYSKAGDVAEPWTA
jgi:hypothetical protein